MAARYPAQLSGGQRQRVGVARALAADPPLMLMDEPFGAIDPINRERLQNEFLRLQAEIRKTIVFVTHDIDEAIKMGDRIAILQVGGKLAQYATAGGAAHAPGERRSSRTSSAPTARSSGSRCMRVRDVNLWTPEEVPRARAGRRPAAAGLARPAGRQSTPVLTVDRDDILRDALLRLLLSETPVRRGRRRATGRLAGSSPSS